MDYNLGDTKPKSTRPWTSFQRKSRPYPSTKCIPSYRRGAIYGDLWRFHTSRESHLRIWLSSATADPVVALVNEATNTIIELNDTSSEHGPTDAQIADVFGAGRYIIEVTHAAHVGGASYSLIVFVQEKMERHGHQSDHTVQWKLGEMPDEGAERWLFPNVIEKAAERWNFAATRTTPHVRFCKEPVPPDPDNLEEWEPDPDECPSGDHAEGRNADGITVVVKVTKDTDKCVDPEGAEGIACADADTDSNGHMVSDEIWFEHPTHTLSFDMQTKKVIDHTVKWMNTVGMDRTKKRVAGMPTIFVYLRGIAFNEFGHVAGLKDLELADFPGFVMAVAPKIENVPDRDVTYLQQVYRNEHGAAPHDSQGNPLE